MQNITLILTGERRREHFRVFVNGEPMLLQNVTFIALVDLLCARLRTPGGYADVNKRTIHRLRDVLGRSGMYLVETGNSGEYRIAIPAEDFAAKVGLTDCFDELAKHDVVSADQLKLLREHCNRCKLPRRPASDRRETRRRPTRDRQGTKRRPTGDQAETA